MIKLFVVSIILKMFDIITTLVAISNYSNAEINPFSQGLIYIYGIVPGLLINAGLYMFLMYVLYKHNRSKLLIISVITMLIIVCINLSDLIFGLVGGG